MLVAVIDGGIDQKIYPELTVKYDLVVEKNGSIRPRKKAKAILSDHGTTCARIIHKYAPEAIFCSLQVFQTAELRANIEQMTAALTWCLTSRVPIIHMSIGSRRLSDEPVIREMAAQLCQQGQILVCAVSNAEFCYTMPACFSGVLGVTADPELSGCAFRVMKQPLPDGPILCASSKHILKTPDNTFEETEVFNSYAAPTITAHVHNILRNIGESEFPFPAVWKALGKTRDLPLVSLRPDYLTEAIVYDPCDMLKGEDRIGFRIVERQSSASAFFASLEKRPNIPALVLPTIPKGKPDFWNQLSLLCLQRTGIVVAGEVPDFVRRKMPCLVWDETVYRNLLKRIPQGQTSDFAPTIQIEPFGDEAFRFMCELKTALQKNGVECLAFSDYPYSYLYDVEYIMSDCSPIDLLAYHSRTKKPDVLLCSVSKQFPETGESIHITLSDAPVCFDSTTGHITLPNAPSKQIFEKLISFLLSE